MTARTITPADCNRFFLPLIFTAELMFISHSIIHAFLARLDNPKITLAAFSIAFTLSTTVGSPLWSLPQVAISYITDRRSIRRQIFFGLQVAMTPVVFLLLIAFTPLGDWFYATLNGASPAAVVQAKSATIFFTFIFLAVIGRNIFTGLIMINRRTSLITLSTLVRLASLGGLLFLLPKVLSGASVGAAALVSCITVDGIFTVWVGWNFYRALPEEKGEAPSYASIWKFSWPLMINQFAENMVFLTINLFLGRLARADLALASFGVMRGIVMLVVGPLRNLSQTSQTLTHSREDLRVMMRFSLFVVVGFTVLVLALFLSPLRWWVLEGVMGLTGEMSRYTAPALGYAFLVSVFWGFSSVFRGLVMSARRTGSLAPTAGLRVVAVIAVGSVTLVWPEINGALVGILAMAATFAVEALVLGWALFFSPEADALFPSSQAKPGAESG